MGVEPIFCLCEAMEFAIRLERTVQGLGYELVDFERSSRGLVRIFIDKPAGVGVEDCALVSHQLTQWLNAEGYPYERLEVSSPGLDRPLKTAKDFARFRGAMVQVRLRMPRDGRRNFTGVLGTLQDGVLQMEVDGEAIRIELAGIDKAKLVPKF